MDSCCQSSKQRHGSILVAVAVALFAIGCDVRAEPPVVLPDNGATTQSQRLWELVNVGNGYFQIRLYSPTDSRIKCLTTFKDSDEVKLLDCATGQTRSSMLHYWSFDRLMGGGYHVVGQWADFYGDAACLTAAGDAPRLGRCRDGDGRVRSLQGIAKLYADPTEP